MKKYLPINIEWLEFGKAKLEVFILEINRSVTC